MQINENLAVTRTGLVCRLCGERSSQSLLSGQASVCRHASPDQVRRILRLLEERHRRRQAPTKEGLCSVESQNHNGTYTVSLAGDGSFVCTCLSVLGSRDLAPVDARPEVPVAACKHIQSRLSELQERVRGRTFPAPKPPTEWQKLVFKALSVDAHERLTAAQAYWAIHELLEKQGVDYLELEERMRRDLRTTLLPINAFGVEFEGFGVPHVTLARALTDAGLPTTAEGYNHATRDHFKVVSDASVQGPNPFELVTPKLFGASGFARIRALCRVVTSQGGDANVSTGLHVHVDAWNCKIRDARNLLGLWHRIQPVVLMLVPPSRRGNHYAKPVTPELIEAVSAMRSVSQLGRIDRYFSLNLSAYARHGTFEFRLHSGSFNAEKVVSWVVLVLLVTAAARAGIDPSSVPQTWEGVAEAIGLASGTSVVRQAHRYLSQRYAHFTRDAATPSSGAVA
jgi:hypothetical protein